jgi:hypothetical protein
MPLLPSQRARWSRQRPFSAFLVERRRWRPNEVNGWESAPGGRECRSTRTHDTREELALGAPPIRPHGRRPPPTVSFVRSGSHGECHFLRHLRGPSPEVQAPRRRGTGDPASRDARTSYSEQRVIRRRRWTGLERFGTVVGASVQARRGDVDPTNTFGRLPPDSQET